MGKHGVFHVVHSITEIPQSIDIHWVPVSDEDQAREVFDEKGYNIGWFYSRKIKWLIVRKQEYEKLGLLQGQ